MSKARKIPVYILVVCLGLSLLGTFSIRAETIIRGQDKGPEVEKLQTKLKSLGYYEGKTDGVFGVRTELSLEEFQEEADLRVDGIAGPKTLDKINSLLEEEGETASKPAEQEQPERRTAPILRRGDRGEAVSRLQTRLSEKGFLNGNVDGNFGLQTQLALELAQRFYGLKVDGVAGPRTWQALNREESTFRNYTVKRGDTLWDLSRKWSMSVEEIKNINNLEREDFIKAGDTLKVPGKVEPKEVEVIHWHTVDNMIDCNQRLILTDVESGLSFRVERLGGSNHADVEPLTAKDTRVFRQIYGGDWSWERRALIAHINGRHVAASINGQPHANQTITSNQFPGHICLHFEGSKLHKEEKQDNKHQEMVEKAGRHSWPLGSF